MKNMLLFVKMGNFVVFQYLVYCNTAMAQWVAFMLVAVERNWYLMIDL